MYSSKVGTCHAVPCLFAAYNRYQMLNIGLYNLSAFKIMLSIENLILLREVKSRTCLIVCIIVNGHSHSNDLHTFFGLLCKREIKNILSPVPINTKDYKIRLTESTNTSCFISPLYCL